MVRIIERLNEGEKGRSGGVKRRITSKELEMDKMENERESIYNLTTTRQGPDLHMCLYSN